MGELLGGVGLRRILKGCFIHPAWLALLDNRSVSYEIHVLILTSVLLLSTGSMVGAGKVLTWFWFWFLQHY